MSMFKTSTPRQTRNGTSLSTSISSALRSLADRDKPSPPLAQSTARTAQARHEHAEQPGHHFGQYAIFSQREQEQPPPPALQRSAITSAPFDQAQIGTRIQAARGGGQPLNSDTRSALETGLGADLSSVRVHTSSQADNMARSVQARAFTTGNDIFFRSGAYQPSTREGIRLLAHEATHTIQQAAEPVGGIVIQRALDAQKSLTAASTGAVPDLSSATVMKLTNACQSTATPAERDGVIKDIYDELQAQHIIDNVDRNDLKYGGANSATYGITRSGSNKTPSGDYKAEVDIYSAAFDAGPAVVYSTIRHELIHAEQYRQASATPKPSTDTFFYEERGASGQVLKGQGAEFAVKAALSEIETYAWEIAHAGETGVEKEHLVGTKLPGKTETFKEQRIKELTVLYGNLIKFSDELSYDKQQKWSAYILRAKSLAESALGLTTAAKRSIIWKTSSAKPKTSKVTPGSTKPKPVSMKTTRKKTAPPVVKITP